MKKTISTQAAPGAIGPYSQAVKVGEQIFLSGQIPIDPATGEFVSGGISEQTRQVLKNITAVLEAAGVELENVVKTTVFLSDLGEFGAMNEVYAEFFKTDPPARSTIEASALPMNAKVEIDCIVVS